MKVEAANPNFLLGFSVVREVFAHVAVAMWGCYLNSHMHPSDFVYFNLVQHYSKTDHTTLDLGYSMHEKLMKYKLRWGANVNNGPFGNVSYSRADYTPPMGHWHWWLRDVIRD